jgi:hypothetical protein
MVHQVHESLDPFTTRSLVEMNGADSQTVCESMTGVLVDHLVGSEYLWQAINRLPSCMAKTFLETRLPHGMSLKRGSFGEVLAASMLEEFHGHLVPVRKLRFRTSAVDSPTATDLLSLRVGDSGEIVEVAFGEVKVRTTRAGMTGLAVGAHNQLREDVAATIPSVMSFAVTVLSERQDPLGDALLDYLLSRRAEGNETYHIVLVVEQCNWREEDLQGVRELNERLSPLDIHIVKIDSLAEKVDALFESIGVICLDEDE